MSRHAARSVRRAPVLLVVVGALVAGGLADRAAGQAQSASVTAPTVPAMPVAAPGDAFSSSWYCAGATSGSPDLAGGEVEIANAGTEPATGTVTVVSTDGAQSVVPISVPAGGSAAVPESVKYAGTWVGAIVDVDRGSVAVDQVTDGVLGRTVSPCASSPSPHWYFPYGQTLINADQYILLLNPYPTSRIVDLTFSTNQGVEQPQDYQGIAVPADGLYALDLRQHLRRRSSIATVVTARSGGVVAWQTSVITPPTAGQAIVGTPAAGQALADPALPVPGVTVSLGAPSAGTTWVWPDGLADSNLTEEYVIFNPSSQVADVRLSVELQQGTAEPLPLTVGPDQAVPVASELQARIPAGVAHSATLTVTNGVPVVATRIVSDDVTKGRYGVGNLDGARLAAERWVVPVPATDAHHAGSLIVYNPAATTVQVTAGPARFRVGAGGRTAVPVGPAIDTPFVVSASAPVYVEYDLYGTGNTPGVSLAFAIPLS